MPLCPTKRLLLRESIVLIDTSVSVLIPQVKELCRAGDLEAPKGFLAERCTFYAKYEGDSLTSLIAYSVANLNGTPSSIGVSIDLILSVTDTHDASNAVNNLLNFFLKRYKQTVIFTQVANTDGAYGFWAGRLTHSSRSSILPVLFNAKDTRYKIYCDCRCVLGIFKGFNFSSEMENAQA